MDRRAYVKKISPILLIASLTGCGTNGSSTVETPLEDTSDNANADTPAENAGNQDSTSVPIEVLEHDWTTTEQDSPLVEGKLRNTSSEEIGLVRIEGDFFDNDGTIIHQSTALVRYIAPGDTHTFRVWYVEQNASRVEDYELSYTVNQRGVGTENAGEIEIRSQEMAEFETQGWGITGEIENKSQTTFSEVEILSQFYIRENMVEFAGSDAVRDFDPNDRYEFAVHYNGQQSKQDISDYRLKIIYLE